MAPKPMAPAKNTPMTVSLASVGFLAHIGDGDADEHAEHDHDEDATQL